ncbi:MAG: hypothetical protein A2812_02415 [Candidatus Staskawiczbacteria bacterium RIFCSPHIGHO2_01_FULL_36_16]|uniref:Type 4 fimbrial biogenesis protein PilX N-terminal domain-containing protein n=1 Tax=Candidatus Staskawiczbacteria bacterium RIFCSPHIGHO2_01_FULL_36_16 TaxID=1802200 RepID=A0A1G2HT49_9BACT|nr:MAG: hypothetical protein A2812_02415 [Candidatus Staskawiczbacteria bacterium RIFCSPHIGHO2_01_FULL_36_16]
MTPNNSQKGVSLIITFFIAIIILFIVLSISTLLYSEIKVIRNIGNSVNAFYTAESGIEKVLYYDRKTPDVEGRGVCSICNDGIEECDSVTGSDCSSETCSDCYIEFSTQLDSARGRYYNLDIIVGQQCLLSTSIINSYGFYEDASRAINLSSLAKVSNLVMPEGDAGATIDVHGKVRITATVIEPPGTVIESVKAYITGLGDDQNCDPECSPEPCCMYRIITLQSGGDGTWSKPWNDGIDDEPYTIQIIAWDTEGGCVEVTVEATPI